MHVTLGQMEVNLLDYKDTIYIEGNEVIRIGGYIAINEYEFLSSDYVNVHAITEFIDF